MNYFTLACECIPGYYRIGLSCQLCPVNTKYDQLTLKCVDVCGSY
jgi:hypothetical protein